MDDVDIFGVQRGNPKVTGWKSAMQELEARSPWEEITVAVEDVLDVKEEVITD